MAFNTPSAVHTAGTHNWIASNDVYNALKPNNNTTEAHVWGSQDITGLIEDVMGAEKNYVSALLYRHFEDDRLHQTVIAAGTGTGVVGATITYTADTTNYIANFPATPNEPYVATGTQVNLMPVRVSDILVFHNEAQGIVTAVNAAAHTFDVTSTNGIALPSTTNAVEIINMGPTAGEGADSPKSRNVRQHTYSNIIETVNDAYEYTGRSAGERTWIEYTYNGKTEAKWHYKGIEATNKYFRNCRELKMIVGQKVIAATGINAYDPTLTRTEGMIPFASSYNAKTTFSKISGLTLDDFHGIITDVLDKNAGSSEYSVINSITNRKAIDAFIRPEMKNGGIQYAGFSGGEKQSVNFGFNSFTTLGYSMHLMTYSPLNNPTQLGANGHKYKDYSVFCPMKKDTYAVGEKKERVEVPAMRMNYLKNGSTNREWSEWLTGGADGVWTNTIDKVQVNFRSDFGFEGFGANRWTAMQGI